MLTHDLNVHEFTSGILQETHDKQNCRLRSPPLTLPQKRAQHLQRLKSHLLLLRHQIRARLVRKLLPKVPLFNLHPIQALQHQLKLRLPNLPLLLHSKLQKKAKVLLHLPLLLSSRARLFQPQKYFLNMVVLLSLLTNISLENNTIPASTFMTFEGSIAIRVARLISSR